MPTRARNAMIGACVVAIAAAACGSYTTYQTAEPLPPGRWQVSLAAAPGVFLDRPTELNTPTIASELAIRRGMADDTDLGLKLYAVGAELSVRHRFVDSPATWSWAVLGAIGGVRTNEGPGTTDAAIGQLRIAAAATRRTSPRWAFSVGPVATTSWIDFAESSSAAGLMLGGFANAELSWGGTRCWHFIPELSLHATLAGDVPVRGAVVLLGAAVARDF